nr:hypothetical protein [Tanacetum cinerariifolium]
MNDRTYRCVLCYRLGVLLFLVPNPCPTCSWVFVDDIYRDHVVNKHRHNFVRDTLVDIRFMSEVLTCKKVDIGLGVRRDKPLPLTDMLLYSWDGCLDVCVDLTCSSPLTQSGMIDFVPGHAVVGAAQRKRVKYEAKCANTRY